MIFAFTAAGFIVPLSMMFSPKFEERVTIISMIFILVAATMAFAKLKNFSVPAKKFLPTIATIFCTVCLIEVTVWFFWVSGEMREQENYILQHRDEEIIKLPPLKPMPDIFNNKSVPIDFFSGITEDENFYLNVLVAKYYEAKKS